MNLSKLVVAAVSFAAFALVWVPGRGGHAADTYGARAHRALAHAAMPEERVEAIGADRRVDQPGPEAFEAVPATAPAPPALAAPPSPSPARALAPPPRRTRADRADRAQSS